MLDLALLGLLSDQPLHGYELRKQLGELVGARTAVSFGSLYPALGRLEKAGLVTTVDAGERAHVPMTGSLGAEVAALRARRPAAARSRRTRKVYAIAPAGERRLAELLGDPTADDRTFAVQVAFCRHLAPEARLELFERRRAELQRRLVANGGEDADGVDGLRDRYRRAVGDREAHALRAELTWLDSLIDDEVSLGDDDRTPTPITGGSPR